MVVRPTQNVVCSVPDIVEVLANDIPATNIDDSWG